MSCRRAKLNLGICRECPLWHSGRHQETNPLGTARRPFSTDSPLARDRTLAGINPPIVYSAGLASHKSSEIGVIVPLAGNPTTHVVANDRFYRRRPDGPSIGPRIRRGPAR